MGLFSKWFYKEVEAFDIDATPEVEIDIDTPSEIHLEIYRDEEVGIALRNRIGVTIASTDLGDINPHAQETPTQQAEFKARACGWEPDVMWVMGEEHRWCRVTPAEQRFRFIGDVSVADAFELVKNSGYEPIELVTYHVDTEQGQTTAQFKLAYPKDWIWGFYGPLR